MSLREAQMITYGYSRSMIDVKDILNLIISYYHIIEKFLNSGVIIQSVDDGQKIKSKYNDNHDRDNEFGDSVYGRYDVHDNIKSVAWTFKLSSNNLGVDYDNKIFIGITNTRNALLDAYCCYFCNIKLSMILYGITSNGLKVTILDGEQQSDAIFNDCNWKKEDKIKMTFHRIKKTLTFERNNISIASISNMKIQKKDVIKMIISIKGFYKQNEILSLYRVQIEK